MAFIKSLGVLIECSLLIFSKKHLSLKRKFSLLLCYFSIVIKRKLRRRFGAFFNYSKQRILGFDVLLDNFREDFYWIFKEIFIEENYYFKSDREDPFIIDCGGNIGISVLYFKTIYPKSKIITFEPNPSNLKLLNENLKKNAIVGVKVYDLALGARDGSVDFFTHGPGTTMYEEFSIKQKKVNLDEAGLKVKAKIVRLSPYVSQRVDYLKLDVEGAESDILCELKDSGSLSKVDRIGMEYHQFSSSTNKLSVVANVLEEGNFFFFCASGARNLSEPVKSNYKTFMIFASRNR